ncbi:hypothetical protein V2P11_09850 [Parageobacillus toebii]|uniref:hypothetical protein n=1 Tax=Parageobacillus toebii TaxID=153151 RepID=UPI0035C7816B
MQVVKEALEVGNKALVAKRYELNSNLTGWWFKAYQEKLLEEETVIHSSSSKIKKLEGK